MSIVLVGSTSGSITLQEPAVAGTTTINLPASTGTMALLQTPSFATTIGVGGATPSTSGAGITFPATQSASSDANTLDDYEEGTFTPTLSGGFSVAPTSYTNQNGRYTKIGRLVYFTFDIDPNGATANGSTINFGGLPFTVGTSSPSAGLIGYQASFNTNAGDTIAVEDGSTGCNYYTSAGSGRAGNASNVNINNRIIFSGCYSI
jgi:hypothetical protein